MIFSFKLPAGPNEIFHKDAFESSINKKFSMRFKTRDITEATLIQAEISLDGTYAILTVKTPDDVGDIILQEMADYTYDDS